MTNPECLVKVTVYRLPNGGGEDIVGARFQYQGSREYSRSEVEMTPVPLDELYEAAKEYPGVALNVKEAAAVLETADEWSTVVEVSEVQIEEMFMQE